MGHNVPTSHINLNKSIMEKLSKESQEKLSTMNGCEVRSVWNYEGVVYVKKDEVWQNGKKIDILDTNDKIQDLFDELFQDEFGDSEIYI